MTENRIRLSRDTAPQSTHEDDQVRILSDVEIEVTTQTGFMGKAGMVLVVVGALSLLLGLVLLLLSFPDRLYGFTVPAAEARVWAEAVLLCLGAGFLLTLLGATFHFYGRSVFGRDRDAPTETFHG